MFVERVRNDVRKDGIVLMVWFAPRRRHRRRNTKAAFIIQRVWNDCRPWNSKISWRGEMGAFAVLIVGENAAGLIKVARVSQRPTFLRRRSSALTATRETAGTSFCVVTVRSA